MIVLQKEEHFFKRTKKKLSEQVVYMTYYQSMSIKVVLY